MGTLKVTVDCRVEGPLSSGEADRAAEDWAQATTQALAGKGIEMLGAFPMDKTGRGDGGFRQNLRLTRVSPTLVRIPGPTVRGVVFAPWLEGTSKRNEDSSFKGYHLFRATRRELSKMAPQVAQAELEKVLPRMGGA